MTSIYIQIGGMLFWKTGDKHQIILGIIGSIMVSEEREE